MTIKTGIGHSARLGKFCIISIAIDYIYYIIISLNRLPGLYFLSYPYCNIGFTRFIIEDACHNRVTPNGICGIAVIHCNSLCNFLSHQIGAVVLFL